jgi:hypothetical protein
VRHTRASDLQSLVWLYRWHSGREKRLAELHEHHLRNLVRLVLTETENDAQVQSVVSANLDGFAVTLSFSSSQVAILEIQPPLIVSGKQLDLFCESNDELDGESWPCETNDEDVSVNVETTIKEVVSSEVVVG